MWEVRGRVEIANSVKEFLDADAVAIKAENWIPVSDKNQLRLAVKSVSADKKKLAKV